MAHKHDRSGVQKGSIVLLAIFLALFIAALMITVELLRLSDTETVTNHIEDMQAYYCAEAGIEYEILILRNANANPTVRAAGVACPSTTRLVDCSNDRGFVDTGWYFRYTDQTDKADPNFTYCNLSIVTSTGCKGSFAGTACTGTFKRSVRAEIRRTNRSNNLRYVQILRWREL